MYYLLIVITFFIVASYFDIKTRELPPVLTYSLLFLGLVLHVYESFVSRNPDPLLYSSFMGLVCFVFAFTLYRTGVWAGGDVKLFTGLGTMLPQFNGLLFFPFLILAAAFIAILPFMIIYISYFLLKNKKLRKKVKQEFLISFKRSFWSPFYVLAAYEIALLANLHWLFTFLFVFALVLIKKIALPIVVLFTIIAAYTIPFFTLNYLVYLFIFSILFFIGISSFKVAKTHILREKVKTTKLKQGMIPAQDLIRKGRKTMFVEPTFISMLKPPKNLVIDSRKARGLSAKEIQILKKLKIKEMVVKKSIPLVPVITIGILIAVVLQMFLYVN